MDNIKFKFDYDNYSNTLDIEGTRELLGVNYVCSVRGSLYDINLQETIDRIKMSIQDKIINDFVEKEHI